MFLAVGGDYFSYIAHCGGFVAQKDRNWSLHVGWFTNIDGVDIFFTDGIYSFYLGNDPATNTWEILVALFFVMCLESS